MRSEYEKTVDLLRESSYDRGERLFAENEILRRELLASAAALEAGQDPLAVASQMRYTLRLLPTIVNQTSRTHHGETT